MRRFLELALIFGVFIVVGPLVGLLIFAIAGGVATIAGVVPTDLTSALSVTAFLLLYGTGLAHMAGLVPAGIAGFMVAGYAGCWGRVPLIAGALAGAAGMSGAYLRSGIGAMMEQTGELGSLGLLLILTHILAAVGCTMLTRRWQ